MSSINKPIFSIQDDNRVLFKGTLGKMFQHFQIMQASLGEVAELAEITGKRLSELPVAATNWEGDLKLYANDLLLIKASLHEDIYYVYQELDKPGLEGSQPPADLWKSLEARLKLRRA